MAMSMEEIQARMNGLESGMGTVNGQYQQPQQLQQPQISQETIEKFKVQVCTMLQDLYSEDFKRIACNCMADKLIDILTMPLHAQDRIFFQRELSKLQNPNATETTQPNFKSAEDLVNNSNKKHNKNNHNGNNKNRDSQKGDNMV